MRSLNAPQSFPREIIKSAFPKMISKRVVGWGVALLLLTSIEAAAADTRRVLLLNPFDHAFSPWSDMALSFRAELVKQSPEPIDIYEVSIDTARFQSNQDDEPFVEYLRALFSKRKLDLIVPIGAPAAYFVERHRSALFPSTPALVVGADQRRVPLSDLDKNETAVSLALDLSAYIENVLRVRPDTQNIAVIIGNSPVEKYWLTEVRNASQPFANRVNFIWFNDLSFGDMLKQSASLPPQSALFYYLISEDANGVPYAQDRALDALHAVATAPIFGLGDYELGRGIVGGPLLPSRSVGEQAAGAAVRILKGERPSDIKVTPVGFGAPVYDWRELQKWGISESRLPPGSIVQFREQTVVERYRWQIMSIVAALLVQSLLIGGLFLERSRRRRAEIDARQRMRQLAYVNRSILAGELSASIAHEINQPLAAIVSSGNAGMRWLGAKAPNIEEAVESFRRIVSAGLRASSVIETVRGMFKKDATERVQTDINNLIGDVLVLMRHELDEHEVQAKSVLTTELPHVVVDRIQLQQVILNLVRNAVEAMSLVLGRPAVLRLRSEATEAGEIIVLIEDSGPGVAPENIDRIFEPFFTTKPKGMGMGLSICRSIVEAHGGRLTARPGKLYGSVFELVLPVGR